MRQALDKEQVKVASAAKDEKEAKEEAKPTWKLRVYEGDKLREEQVELPAEPEPTGKEPSKTGKQLQQFLKLFLRGA